MEGRALRCVAVQLFDLEGFLNGWELIGSNTLTEGYDGRFGDSGGGVMVDPYEDSIYQATGIPGLCGNVGAGYGGVHAPKHSQGIGAFAST
jgi:hypothetical protein